jgi:hypothetical protein
MMIKVNIFFIVAFLAFGCKNAYEPYKEKSVNLMYNSLFCDNIKLYKPDTSSIAKKGYPWDIILSDTVHNSVLSKVANDSSVDMRLRILAMSRLRNNKNILLKKALLGVVIELGTDNGPDVIAAYKDGHAVHIDQSGKITELNNRDITSDSLINQLFIISEIVVNKIGPCMKPRLPYPEKDSARMTFLLTTGLCQGQASKNNMLENPLAGPVLIAGGDLLKYLIIKTEK